MRVRVWNAYASNNSGSYTIVGDLPSAEIASDVARELAAMIAAHTAWREGDEGAQDDSTSPLAVFCRTNGLAWVPGVGGSGDWPEYGEDNRPRVVAIGQQVIVHHEYTISLPAAFGEYFYKRGGRVSHEEDHAHHPIVTIAGFWWGWSKQDRATMEAELPKLVAELIADDSVLFGGRPTWPAAWRVGKGFGEAPFTVGVIFDDLIGGVSALQAAADRHGARMHVRLNEAPDDAHDPLAYLRPSMPASAPRFDVVVTDAGGNRPAVVAAVVESLGYYEGNARARLLKLPAVLALGVPAARADAAAASLRRAGATVDLVRNDA